MVIENPIFTDNNLDFLFVQNYPALVELVQLVDKVEIEGDILCYCCYE